MDLKSFLSDNQIPYKENIQLAELTGMSLSGVLPLIAKPRSIAQLECLYRFIISGSFSHIIIGGLTNTYLCDGFYRDIIIQTIGVKDIVIEENRTIVGAGYGLSRIARELSEKGVSGYEGFVGIPGTVGAAAINNSGAFGYEMSNVVVEVRGIDSHGNGITYTNEQMVYSPRNSLLKGKEDLLVTSIVLNTSTRGDIPTINNAIQRYSIIRRRDIDGHRKSLGSIVAGHSLMRLWDHNRLAFFVKRCLFFPFRRSNKKKEIQCKIDFGVLGGLHLAKFCDSIGRFCWTKDTKESDFFEYLFFIKSKSKNEIQLEIDIKQ